MIKKKQPNTPHHQSKLNIIRSDHLVFGKTAELFACQHLETKGLKLLSQNYRCYLGEIDLIMQDQDHIVFVEVRARQRTDYGNALESITEHKQKKLIRAATCFLQWKKWLYKVNSRFDVVAIHLIRGEIKIEWIKNAFTATW